MSSLLGRCFSSFFVINESRCENDNQTESYEAACIVGVCTGEESGVVIVPWISNGGNLLYKNGIVSASIVVDLELEYAVHVRSGEYEFVFVSSEFKEFSDMRVEHNKFHLHVGRRKGDPISVFKFFDFQPNFDFILFFVHSRSSLFAASVMIQVAGSKNSPLSKGP